MTVAFNFFTRCNCSFQCIVTRTRLFPIATEVFNATYWCLYLWMCACCGVHIEAQKQLSGAVSYLLPVEAGSLYAVLCSPGQLTREPCLCLPSVESGVTDDASASGFLCGAWGWNSVLQAYVLASSLTPVPPQVLLIAFFFHSICFRIPGVYNPPSTPHPPCYILCIVWVNHK